MSEKLGQAREGIAGTGCSGDIADDSLAGTLILRPPTYGEVIQVAAWRNLCRDGLRTYEMASEASQKAFYEREIAVTNKGSQWWALAAGNEMVAFGGINHISQHNRSGEISLIANPAFAGRGFGGECVGAMLQEAFLRMNLHQVFGECYACNKAVAFWQGQVAIHEGVSTRLPSRKFWQGKYWDSYYFVFFNPKETHESMPIH